MPAEVCHCGKTQGHPGRRPKLAADLTAAADELHLAAIRFTSAYDRWKRGGRPLIPIEELVQPVPELVTRRKAPASENGEG